MEREIIGKLDVPSRQITNAIWLFFCTDAHKLWPCDDIAPKKLAKRLRARRARFRPLDMNYPRKAVARTIAVLEAS